MILIIFTLYCKNHCNDKGERCHGSIAKNEVVPWSTKCAYASQITNKLRQNIKQLCR